MAVQFGGGKGDANDWYSGEADKVRQLLCIILAADLSRSQNFNDTRKEE